MGSNTRKLKKLMKKHKLEAEPKKIETFMKSEHFVQETFSPGTISPGTFSPGNHFVLPIGTFCL
jgi:hypothetical protein